MHLPIITCLVHRVLSTTKCLRNLVQKPLSSVPCFGQFRAFAVDEHWIRKPKQNTTKPFEQPAEQGLHPVTAKGESGDRIPLSSHLISSSLMHSPTAPRCCCHSTALPTGHDVQLPLFQEGLSSVFSLSLPIFLSSPIISNDC